MIYDVEEGRPAMGVGIAQYTSFGSEGRGLHYTAVVPVVGDDWDQSQPVGMWAVCQMVLTSGTHANKEKWKEHRDEGCGGAWKAPDWHRAIHFDTSLGTEDLEEAIALHHKTYETESAKGAVAVQWIETVDPIIAKSGTVSFAWLIAALVGWPLVGGALRLGELLARRKASHASVPSA